MWEYMQDKKGEHEHAYQGNRIDVEISKPKEDQDRERAVRKVVRTLFEKEGGEAATVRDKTEALYKKGEVWYEDVMVAEWKNDDMHFLAGCWNTKDIGRCSWMGGARQNRGGG
eukprot:6708409-Karenia_brevis.AAC.1